VVLVERGGKARREGQFPRSEKAGAQCVTTTLSEVGPEIKELQFGEDEDDDEE